MLDEVFKKTSTQAWLDKLQGLIPVASVKTPREALEDRKLRSEGKIEELKFNATSMYEMLSGPILAGQNISPAPCPPIGTDTFDILSSVGYSAEEIAEMEASGMI